MKWEGSNLEQKLDLNEIEFSHGIRCDIHSPAPPILLQAHRNHLLVLLGHWTTDYVIYFSDKVSVCNDLYDMYVVYSIEEWITLLDPGTWPTQTLKHREILFSSVHTLYLTSSCTCKILFKSDFSVGVDT